MQVYKYNQMSCDLDLFSWASREVTCILKHHKWCTVSCKSSTFRSHESLSTLMATSIYDGFHKISGVNFKLCACLIPADSWGKIVSWDTCWTLDDPFRTAKVWKIEILFRHQGAQGAVTLPQKNKIRRQDFKLVNLGNWLEDIEDMWDLYSYVDCQCHYILLQCIFFLLNIYIYIYVSIILSQYILELWYHHRHWSSSSSSSAAAASSFLFGVSSIQGTRRQSTSSKSA